MSTKFWYGGTGNWNAGTTHWSLNSGNSPASTTTTPTAADDVVFDANSGTGTVTINVAATCHSFDASAASSSLVFRSSASATPNFTCGGSGNTGMGAAVFKLQSGGSWDMSSGTNFTWFHDNRSGGITITSNGVAMSNMVNGIGAKSTATTTLTIADSCNIGTKTFDLTAGTNCPVTVSSGATLTCGAFTFEAGLTLSGGTLSCTSFTNSGASNTITTNGSTAINCTGDWSNTVSTLASGTVTITAGAPGSTYPAISTSSWQTFSQVTSGNGANFTFTSQANNTSYILVSSSLTTTGNLTFTGLQPYQRLHFYSDTVGTARTMTCNTSGAVSITNTDFRDITGAGTGSGWTTGTSVGDALGNSGITFTSPVTRYRVDTSGHNFHDPSYWSTSSGGSTGASMPLPQDNIVIDNNSFNADGAVVTCAGASFKSLDGSACTNHTWSFTNTNGDWIEIFGDITAGSKCISLSSAKGSTMVLGRTTQTWSSTYSNQTTIQSPCVDHSSTNLTFAGGFNVSNSALLVHTATVTFTGDTTVGYLTSTNTSNSKTFVGTSGVNLSISGTSDASAASSSGVSGALVLDFQRAGWTVNPNGMNLKCNGNGVSTHYLAGASGTPTWGDILLSSPSSPLSGTINFGTYTYTGSSPTVRSFAVDANNQYTGSATLTVAFLAGGTFNLAANAGAGGSENNPYLPASFFYKPAGTSSNLSGVTITSTSSGTAFTLSNMNGYTIAKGVSLQDCSASGQTPFFAGSGSTNVSGNTNWMFTDLPPNKPDSPPDIVLMNMARTRSSYI